jgi:hypothetical protein
MAEATSLQESFDELYQSLIETEIDKLPVELFYQLPTYCLYIEHRDVIDNRQIEGFFVHLERDIIKKCHELRFLLCGTAGETKTLLPQVLHLIPNTTLDQSLQAVLEAGLQAVAGSDSDNGYRQLYEQAAHQTWLDGARQLLLEPLRKLVALTLYCVVQNADWPATGRPQRPQTSRVKGSERFFASPRPARWELGAKLGSALRQAKSEHQTNQTSGETGRTVAPHLRKCHFHAFLIGSRTAENRQYTVKFLAPIPVNMPDLKADVSATIRPAREKPKKPSG